MAALPDGFGYEDENDDAQASTSDGYVSVDRSSNVLGSGGRERANDGNTGGANDGNTGSDNIDYIAARLWIKELKLQVELARLNTLIGQQQS